MAKLIITSLIILQTYSAFGAVTCESLFADNVQTIYVFPYDKFMPVETALESKLRSELRSYENGLVPKMSKSIAQKRLTDALSVYFDYTKMITRIFDSDYTIKMVSFSEGLSFSKESLDRIREMELNIIYRTRDFLDASGIRYEVLKDELGFPVIRLSEVGDHYFNNFVQRVASEHKLTIYIGISNLLRRGGGGMYMRNPRDITLTPNFLLSSSLFREGIFMHEYTHHMDLKSKYPFNPLKVEIKVETADYETLRRLGIYRHGFVLSEIRAFRGLIKTKTHKFIMGNAKAGVTLRQIARNAAYIFEMTEVAHRILDAYRKDYKNLNKQKGKVTIEFSESEIYSLPKMSKKELEKTIELVTYYYVMFSYIKNSANSSAVSGNLEQQGQLIKQINRVISMPEVRRMNGEYPSWEMIRDTYFD